MYSLHGSILYVDRHVTSAIGYDLEITGRVSLISSASSNILCISYITPPGAIWVMLPPVHVGCLHSLELIILLTLSQIQYRP